MLIALAFTHFSSKLLLKERMIIPLKKNVKQCWSYRCKIDRFYWNLPKKNPAKSAVFYWLFLGKVSPRNFPWNQLIFLRICSWKSFEIWLFSTKIPQNQPIFLWILTFLPRKSREIGRFFCKFWLFFREISWFFRKFAPENPTKFCFFPAKYQKPCRGGT